MTSEALDGQLQSCYTARARNCSFVFARWQHRTEGLAAIHDCMFWLGILPPKSLIPLGGQGPHLTQCVSGPHNWTCRMISEFVAWYQQSARMWQTTDRQATEKCAGISRIACTKGAILPKTKRHRKAKICLNVPCGRSNWLQIFSSVGPAG